QPAGVGGIARIAAAEMVVDAALADRCQRAQYRIAIGRQTSALPGPPQQLKDAALREFRRGADAAVQRIHLAQQPFGDLVEPFSGDPLGDALAGLRLAEPLQTLTER